MPEQHGTIWYQRKNMAKPFAPMNAIKLRSDMAVLYGNQVAPISEKEIRPSPRSGTALALDPQLFFLVRMAVRCCRTAR
jgi:hypothetical protein